MGVHTPLGHRFPRSDDPAHTHGHAFAAPRLYDASVEIYFLGRRRAAFQKLMAAADVRPGERVLDVGCGTGYFARLLARTVGREGLVVGIDPSPEMVAYASRKTGRVGHCRFQAGTAESLSFPDAHFDVVVSSLVMHHLPEDVRAPALREMRRVLRPGGRLVVADAQMPRRGLGWRLFALVSGLGHVARLAPDLERLASEAGFREIRTGEALPWLRYVRAVAPVGTATST